MGVVVGSVAIPGSTGNFSVTGLPFEPVAVLFWNQVDPVGPHSMMLGAATSSSDQWVIWTGTDTESSGYNKRYHESLSTRCVFSTRAPFTTVAFACSLVSLNSAGFTLNLVTRNAAGSGEGNNIYYMAIGGSHITEAHAGTFSGGGSSGTFNVTDPGFEPTALIVAHLRDTAIDAGQQFSFHWGVGVAAGGSQYASWVRAVRGVAVEGYHMDRDDSVVVAYNGTETYRAALSAFISNGFTIDVTDAHNGGDITHCYLAIKADGARAGSDIQPDTETATTHNTPGLEPEGVFFCWAGADAPSASGSDVEPLRPGVGGGTLSAQRISTGIYRSSTSFGVWTSDAQQLPTEPLGFWGTGNGIGGSDNQTQASAQLTDMVMGSFELTWYEVVDTNNRMYGWLALPGEVFTWTPHIYRRIQ